MRNLKSVSITIAPEIIVKKADAILAARGALEITSDPMEALAVEALKSVTKAIKEMESSRAAMKKPVADLGKQIDELAREYSKELETEKDRLSRLIGAYALEKQKAAAEEDRKRVAELNRIEEERRKLKEDAERIATEAARSGTPEAQEAAAAQISTLQAQSAALRQESVGVMVPITASKEAGTATATKWRFEVTDVQALFKARPDLVKLEPSTSAINAAIATDQTIPGLKIWSETKTIVRENPR